MAFWAGFDAYFAAYSVIIGGILSLHAESLLVHTNPNPDYYVLSVDLNADVENKDGFTIGSIESFSDVPYWF